MAVMTNIDQVAEEIATAAAATKGDYKASWKVMIKMFAEHFVKNTVVTGTVPSGGGAIVEGKNHMMGMDERTGRVIKGDAWVKQAVRRALKTRKGSRPMTRWYGTNHKRQLGQPITAQSVLDLTSDLADSIEGTIPRSKLNTVTEQENGEQLRVFMQLNTESIRMDFE